MYLYSMYLYSTPPSAPNAPHMVSSETQTEPSLHQCVIIKEILRDSKNYNDITHGKYKKIIIAIEAIHIISGVMILISGICDTILVSNV